MQVRRTHAAVGVAAFTGAVLVLLALLQGRTAHAQDLGLAINKTLRGSEVVQIGQILEFTIVVTNTRGLPITELQVVDTFRSAIVAPSGVGPFARAGDPPLSTPPGTYDGSEAITFNLLGAGEQLREGESRSIVVRLRAVHPSDQLQTVNEARIARAIRSDGRNDGGGGTSVPARPEGARLPLTKTLGVPAPVAAGLPITFTIAITNNGLVDITRLPLNDVFNPAALQFRSSDPPPSAVNATTGVLTWDDLLVATGRTALRPGEGIVVRTSYIALQNIQAAVNRAEVAGARDEYGNALVPRQAEAPIRVVGPGVTTTPGTTTTPGAGATPTRAPRPTDEPTATPTFLPTAGPQLTEVARRRTEIARPSATPAPTDTSAPVASAPTPAVLPATGAPAGAAPPWALLAALALAACGAALLARRRQDG